MTMAIWPQDKPFKLSRNMATGEIRTRTIENTQFFATESEAREAFSAARVRNECSRVLMMMRFGQPDNYGSPNTAECISIKRFRKP